jgi:hypothetical protein
MARKKQAKTSDEAQRTRAECFLLCDYARAENGKLYIVGGGWDHIVPRKLPRDYSAYLATKLVLPGDLLMEPVSVKIELLDWRQQVLGEPVYESTLESERLALLREISERNRLVASLVMGTEAKMTLREPGQFTLRLLVNNETIATTGFTVGLAQSQ